MGANFSFYMSELRTLKAFYLQNDVYYVKNLMIDNVYLVTSYMGANVYFLCPSQREICGII